MQCDAYLLSLLIIRLSDKWLVERFGEFLYCCILSRIQEKVSAAIKRKGWLCLPFTACILLFGNTGQYWELRTDLVPEAEVPRPSVSSVAHFLPHRQLWKNCLGELLPACCHHQLESVFWNSKKSMFQSKSWLIQVEKTSSSHIVWPPILDLGLSLLQRSWWQTRPDSTKVHPREAMSLLSLLPEARWGVTYRDMLFPHNKLK